MDVGYADGRGRSAASRGTRWRAARCAASSSAKACAGAARDSGRRARIPTSSQKGPDRRALHRPTRRRDGPLPRRIGPVTPRNFPPAPGWSADGHRIKAPLDYGRGPDKVWVYGALRVHDGQVLTQTAPARNTTGYLALLAAADQAQPGTGTSISSRIISPVTAAAPSGTGSRPIRVCSRPPFRWAPPGST